MVQHSRSLLDNLKLQLNFLECRKFINRARPLWKSTSIFQDLPTCLNFSDPKRTHPCNECVLIDFVPREKRDEAVPCQHIALTRLGDSLDSISAWAGCQQSEDIVKNWFHHIIEKLEKEAERPSWEYLADRYHP